MTERRAHGPLIEAHIERGIGRARVDFVMESVLFGPSRRVREEFDRVEKRKEANRYMMMAL
jgi:hypothetical protein